MSAPAYISTLGSIIETNEPERIRISSLTEAFLNQGGKIEEVCSTATGGIASHNRRSVEHNAKVSKINQKRRDSYVDPIKALLVQGRSQTQICKELGITTRAFTKIINENNLRAN